MTTAGRRRGSARAPGRPPRRSRPGCAPAPAQDPAEPRKLAHGDEGEPLVVRLEDLAALVEKVAPAGLVVRDARVQHEVVAPTGDRQGVELDRAESAEDLEHGLWAALERSRRREEVPGDEKAARGLGGDLHAKDASYAEVASFSRAVRSGLGTALTAAKLWCRPSPGVQSPHLCRSDRSANLAARFRLPPQSLVNRLLDNFVEQQGWSSRSSCLMPASRNLNLRAASSADPCRYSPISLVAISRTTAGLE